MTTGTILSNREIGATIRLRRKELGLTQKELAARLEITYQQVQRYETGASSLSVETLQKVAVALAIPVSRFFSPDLSPSAPGHPPSLENLLLAHFRHTRRDEADILRIDDPLDIAPASHATGLPAHDRR